MTFRLSRLRAGEWLAGTAAVVMAVALFALTWYGEPAETGWGGATHVRWLLLLAIVVGLALAVAQAAFRAPAVPVCLSVISTVIALLAVLWLIFRVVLDHPPHQEIGAWIALAAALALLIGSFLSMRQEGIAADDGPGEIPVVELPTSRTA